MRPLLCLAVVLTALMPAAAAIAKDAAPADPHQAIKQAFATAIAKAQHGPTTVTLLDQAKLQLPKGFLFVPRDEGKQLMEQMGNREGENFIGLVMGEEHSGDWIVDATWDPAGYVKDDDAKNWKTDELMESLKSGTEESNERRRDAGLGEIEVVGWVEKPTYDAAHQRLVWAASSRDKGEAAASGVNYNTYALGREGYISMNLLCDLSDIEANKPYAKQLLGNLGFVPGKRYQDFSASTDKVAEYGLAALVGGVAAHKLGLFAIIAAFALKSIKLLVLSALGVFAGIRKFFFGAKATPEPEVTTEVVKEDQGGMKLLLLLLGGAKFGKILLTSSTMLLSVVAYSWLFGWPYAVGFVLLIFAHEMGHYAAARQRGLAVGAPTFIPFVGAWIDLKDQPLSVEVEAYVGLAGPWVGTIAALCCYLLARSYDSPLLLAVSYSGFFLNLFNLIPLSPLDGGRVTAALSPRIWLLGVPILIAMFYYRPSPLLLLIALISVPHVLKALHFDAAAPENVAYYAISNQTRVGYGIAYLSLATFLAVMTHEVHELLEATRGLGHY